VTRRPLLAARALLVTLSQTAARLSDLLIAILLVRMLSPAEWAGIALLLSLYAAAIGLGGLGLPEGMLFFLGRLPRAEQRRFVGQTTLLLALTGAVAAAILLGVRPLLARAPFEVAGLLPLLALAVLLEVPTLAAPQLLLAEERVSGAAAFGAGAALLRFGAVTVPIILGRGVHGAVVGLVAYALIRLVLYGILVFALTPSGPVRIGWQSVREQAAFTAPLGLSILAYAINASLGKWFVAAWDTSNLGAYAIAATQVPVIPMLAYATGAVLATRMVHAFHHGLVEQARGYWLASTARMVLLVAPITVGIVLGGPQLLALLFGNRYPAAVLPFQIYSLILLHRIADHGSTLRAAGDTRALWRASSLVLGANIVFGVPLTLGFGMLGTAVGTVAANLVAWLYILSRIARATGSELHSVVPWGLYARVLGLAAAAALLAAWIARLGPPAAPLQLGLRWVIFAALFVAGIRLLGLTRRLPAVPEDHAGFRARAPA